MGRTFEHALAELGFPPEWAAAAPSEAEGWRALRAQQPTCPINALFNAHVGRTIPDPDAAPWTAPGSCAAAPGGERPGSRCGTAAAPHSRVGG